MLSASLFMETKSSLHRVIVWGLPATLVVLGAVNLKQSKNNVFTELGNASYSLYLIQVFTIPIFYKVIKLLHLSPIYNNLYAVFCVIFSALVGYVFYYFVEKNLSALISLIKFRLMFIF